MFAMAGTRKWTITWGFLLGLFPVVRAEDSTAIIVSATVAALFILSFMAAITIFCFYKNGHFKKLLAKKRHGKRHRKHRQHKLDPRNGAPHHPAMYPPNHPMFTAYPQAEPPPPLYFDPYSPRYATYHGPPPEFVQPQRYPPSSMRAPPPGMGRPPYRTESTRGPPGSARGPPKDPVIVIPTSRGTITMKTSSRPKVETYQWTGEEGRGQNGTRRQKPQEFYIEQSYNGIPVIRPIIYVDDDAEMRKKKHHHRTRKESDPRLTITEIKSSDTEAKSTQNGSAVHLNPDPPQRPRSRSPSAHRRTPDLRSRASSVTAAVNAISLALVDDDGDSDSSAVQVPFGNEVSNERRAPDPVAGDVMFFPANTEAPPSKERNRTAGISEGDTQQETVYGYTKVIKTDHDDGEQTTVVTQELRTTSSEVPQASGQSTRISLLRESQQYETEHSATTSAFTTDMRASMSDRLTSMVEDGDKTRFTHYNVGAVKSNDTNQDESIEMRASRRPNTPPNDIPRSSYYSEYAVPHTKRPSTPPNDIPLITPRESTEIPPLNLISASTSAYASPRDARDAYPKPWSPKTDYPVTPKAYVYQAPTTPGYDGDMSLSMTQSSLAPQPSLARSVAVDPVTGEPGSFQARQRLIEAHLQTTGNDTVGKKKNTATKYTYELTEPKSNVQPVNTVDITPGVIPAAPPPPPAQALGMGRK